MRLAHDEALHHLLDASCHLSDALRHRSSQSLAVVVSRAPYLFSAICGAGLVSSTFAFTLSIFASCFFNCWLTAASAVSSFCTFWCSFRNSLSNIAFTA